MELLSSLGPNPKFVRMFIVEKGAEIPTRTIDIVAGENLTAEFRAINPYGQLPVLLSDTGEPLSETIAICEYLDEVLPGPRLIGDTPEERALARMWYRRVDLDILQPMMAGYRAAEGLSFFKDRAPCFPESAAALKGSAAAGLGRLDGLLGAGLFICGTRLTLADLMLYSYLRFFGKFGQGLATDMANLQRWFKDMDGRASARA